MTADGVTWAPWFPRTREPAKCPKPYPSNSELRRWVRDRVVRVNRQRVGPEDQMPAMIWDLVFFPRGQRITVV